MSVLFNLPVILLGHWFLHKHHDHAHCKFTGRQTGHNSHYRKNRISVSLDDKTGKKNCKRGYKGQNGIHRSLFLLGRDISEITFSDFLLFFH